MTEREQFEAWISAPPYEKDLERFIPDGSWPGHYRNYDVQIAWEGWKKRAGLSWEDER